RRPLRGANGPSGLVVLAVHKPAQPVVAPNGSPIVLGIGNGEMFVASDVSALVRHTQRVVYLDDGELATLSADDFSTSTLQARRTAKTPTMVDVDDADYELSGFANFMHKEIFEQPEAVRRALLGRLDERF